MDIFNSNFKNNNNIRDDNMQEFEAKIKLNTIDAEININIEAENAEQAEIKIEEEILSEIVSLLDYAGYNYEIKQKDNQIEKE